MKNILDSLKSGNLGDIGNTLNSALGGNVGAAASKAAGSLGGVGESLKNTLQGNSVGGLLGSAAIGGLLGALFSGKGVQKVAKGALMVGGTAAVGALAWKFYQKWSQTQVSAETLSVPQGTGQGAGQYTGQGMPAQNAPSAPAGWEAFDGQQQPQAALPPAENTALLLLESMVFAARADGHIDETEKSNIHNAVAALFPGQEMTALLDSMLQKPIDPHALAARVRSVEEAHDLYRLSCAAINIDSFMERSYLDGLAAALKLSEAEKKSLEHEAAAAQQQA